MQQLTRTTKFISSSWLSVMIFNTKRLQHSAILFIVLVSGGCGIDFSVEKIDSNIIIVMWETVDSTNRTLELRCFTERDYECTNFAISKTFSKFFNNVEIDFIGIRRSYTCLTAFGPARTRIDLGTLSNRTYNLDITVDRKKSEGQLIVTPEYYEIRLDNQQQLIIRNSPLHRIPANTIWGTVGYHTGSTAELAQTFIDSLQILGAKAQAYQPGNYGYFEINSSGQIITPQNYKITQPFIFNYSNNTSTLKKLVRNYGANYGDSMHIILYSTKGEIFRSWVP
jgi:hypothetical protein